MTAIEAGRFVTYRSAVAVIRESPVIGSGLGTLVPIDFTFGGSRPNTPGMQPGVDDAYLTVAMKSGVLGFLVYAAMMAWPLWAIARRRRDRMAWWFLPAWLGVLGLSLTQSFATTGYGPFGLALLHPLQLAAKAINTERRLNENYAAAEHELMQPDETWSAPAPRSNDPPPLLRGDGEETPLAGYALELVSAAVFEFES